MIKKTTTKIISLLVILNVIQISLVYWMTSKTFLYDVVSELASVQLQECTEIILNSDDDSSDWIELSVIKQ